MPVTMRLRTGLILVLSACAAEPSAPPAPVTTAAPAAPAAPAIVAPAGAPTGAIRPPRLVPAPAGGTVAEVVTAERGAGDTLLVVYVGASWCEPCVAFHDALLAGQLDADLPGVRFLEFDLDRDKARLDADGYSSRYVPLFALPGPDGRASGRQIQGGVKGPGAAANLVQRLRPLLAGEAPPA